MIDIFKRLMGRKASPKKFSSVAQYWRWYYRMLPIWRRRARKDMKHVAESRRVGYMIRQAFIKRRKTISLEQRIKEKAVRSVEGRQARARGRERREKARMERLGITATA